MPSSPASRRSGPTRITEQLEAPVSSYPTLPPYPGNRKVGCPEGSDPNCVRDHYTMYPLQVRFFQNGLTGDDQLRQRVAFALHEILVVSGLKVKEPSAMAPYLNLLAATRSETFERSWPT
jgi:hypothetical protein